MTRTRWGQIRLIGLLSLAFGFSSAQAAVRFSAEFLQDSIEMDQTAELRITYEIEDAGTTAETPQFQASDFDILMESPSVSIQATYDSQRGRFGQRVIRRFAYVLKPRRSGNLKITGIRGKVDQDSVSAPEVQIRVHPSGSGGPAVGQNQRRGGGSNPYGQMPSRNSGSPGNLSGKGPEFFTRVEVAPQEVYKGQQVIASYYLYVRADTQAELGRVHKFPVLKGFFREELEMPVVQGNAPNEQVVHNGIPYVKHLLMKYAAYPLKEGNAIVDDLGLTIRYTRSSPMPGMGDEDDPFDPFGAFRRMVPGFGNGMGLRTWTQGTTKSDTAKVEVLPLPKEGRPSPFSGLVGKFSVTTVVDRTELSAGQPVTVVVKVEGRGNLSGLKPFDFQWPASFEKYETKVQQQVGKDGLSQRIFETLVIPRQSGEFTVPAVPMSFFDPEARSYVTGGTDPIVLRVADAGVLGSGGQTPSLGGAMVGKGGQTPAPSGQGALLREISAAELQAGRWGASPGVRWIEKLAFGFWLIAGVFGVATGVESYRRKKKAASEEVQARGGVWTREKAQRWKVLRENLETASKGDWESLLVALDQVREALLDEVERLLPGQAVRAMSRSELVAELQANQVGFRGTDPQILEQVLALAEDARFAARAGVMSEREIREQVLPEFVRGLSLARKLSEIPLEPPKSP